MIEPTKKSAAVCLFLVGLFHPGNLLGVPFQVVGSLQIEGKLSQGRMVHNAGQSLHAQISFSQLFVAVLVASQGIFTVVQVNGF